MRLVSAWGQIAIWNEAARISPPQEQAEFPDDEELICDRYRLAVKSCEPPLNGHLQVNWSVPFEDLFHEAIETPQHPFGAVVLEAERTLEVQEILKFIGEATLKTVFHLGTLNAQCRSCSMLM